MFQLKILDYLFELVEEGKVKMSRIDDATRKILKLKFELDLFQTPRCYRQVMPIECLK